MSVDEEFATVLLILRSQAETRGVDAFALSLIKAERQVRKLFTYLIYQFPAFGPSDKQTLREVLGSNHLVYFENFLAGIDALYPKSVEELVGHDYVPLKARLDEAKKYRNKIFHGQLTESNLGRKKLTDLVSDIRRWCTWLGEGADAEIGYDGFARNSFQKSKSADLWKRYKVKFDSTEDYRAFIRNHMQRR
jgi:hypothetical protein